MELDEAACCLSSFIFSGCGFCNLNVAAFLWLEAAASPVMLKV